VEALLLEAIARYMLGYAAAAQCPIERVPDLAEPDMIFPSHIHLAPGLLERHARQRTAHAALSAGRGNRVIASEPSISPKIASVHVSNILAKLGVSTRTEAAATVHRLYVLDGQ
jgi:DNA-binding NarL/FixJ family response regulator